MSARIEELQEQQKRVYTSNQITPMMFELICTIRDVKATETVDSVFLNVANENLEVYVFYEKENFDIEDKIAKYFTDWEMEYCYFPEVFIFPLDMIPSKVLSLPQSAMEI